MAELVFIHGLNTYGDHDIHIGPLKFGPMHARLERALAKRGIELVSLSGSPTATPSEQALQLAEQIKERKLANQFHLLGQSTGGLVARALAHHPNLQNRIASVMTIGTPHRGAIAAEFGLAFNQRYPRLQKIFAACGYDTERKLAIFRAFTPAAVSEFNQVLTQNGNISPKPLEVSFICQVARQETSWPLLVLGSRLNPEDAPGDGFISSASQRFGLTEGPFALDHFGELGFFPHLSRTARIAATSEFERLLDAIANTVRRAAQKIV